MARFPHGGEILGAAPANPLLAPVLRPGRDLNRQQALLDLAAIQRIPGLVGYWPADPAYLYEDSAGTVPASVGGVVGCWRCLGPAPVYTPVTVANPGFDADSDWTKGTGWTIAAGGATKAAGTASVLAQAVSLVAGATYVLTWTMTRSAGTLTPRFTGGTTNTGTGMVLSGTYEENFVATTGNATLEFSADASFAGTVDNVTLIAVSNAPALQATTAVKPYLRKTPRSGVYWLDSNTDTSAITATLGNLGTACTVARSGPDGPYFLENVTISSTYNIAPAYGFGGEVAIFNRALTASEKALITRYMRRYDTLYGSLVNASPQMRGVIANTEMVPNFGVITNFTQAWRGCSSLTTFPLLDTSSGTNFSYAWQGCSSLTSFPLLDTSAGTSFTYAWHYCSSLTTFPLLDTSAGTNFSYAWRGCLSLTSFPLLDTSAGTDFLSAWFGCSSLTSFSLLDTSSGTNFAYAWYSCSSLTSFPLLDTSAGTNFTYAWYGCSSLTSFPLLDTSAGTTFAYAWYGCSSLTTFPANFFDAWSATPVADCFFNTWYNCTALTQTSLNNIVASLAVSGKAAPATGTAITMNGAPLLTTMQADSAFMTAINTLKSRNWTPTYKGTAL